MLRFAALDPGGHTGAATFNDETPTTMGEIIVAINAWGALYTWLEECRLLHFIDVLIVEGYRNRPVEMTRGHANTWSENLESQIVGYCRAYCQVFAIEFVVQMPDIKPVGYGMAGLKYVKGKPKMHKQDAIAHGSYWWRTIGTKR